jgi:hypothetical protein
MTYHVQGVCGMEWDMKDELLGIGFYFGYLIVLCILQGGY